MVSLDHGSWTTAIHGIRVVPRVCRYVNYTSYGYLSVGHPVECAGYWRKWVCAADLRNPDSDGRNTLEVHTISVARGKIVYADLRSPGIGAGVRARGAAGLWPACRSPRNRCRFLLRWAGCSFLRRFFLRRFLRGSFLGTLRAFVASFSLCFLGHVSSLLFSGAERVL